MEPLASQGDRRPLLDEAETLNDTFELHGMEQRTSTTAHEDAFRDSISLDGNEDQKDSSQPFLDQNNGNVSKAYEQSTLEKDGNHSRITSIATAVFDEDPLATVKRKSRKQRLLYIFIGTLGFLALLALGGWWNRDKLPELVGWGPSGPPRMQQARVQGNQKALILASYTNQPLRMWALKLTKDWDVYRYLSDKQDSRPSHRTMPPPNTRFQGIPVVRANAGNEAMPYLTYIVDNYEHLAPFNVFMHGHDTAWHQPEHALDKINALNLTSLEEVGWIPIRCSTHLTCTKYRNHNLTTGIQVMPHTMGGMVEGTRALPAFWAWFLSGTPLDQVAVKDVPGEFGTNNGGQFAVSAERIRQQPKEFYEELLAFVSDHDRSDQKLRDIYEQVWKIPHEQRPEFFKHLDSYMIGIIFEKTWHRIFGMPDRYCPDQDFCRKEWFSDAIHCEALNPDSKEGMFNHYMQGNCKVNRRRMRQAIKMNKQFTDPR